MAKSKSLQAGSYHKLTDVIDWLYFAAGKSSLASIFKKAARTNEVEGIQFVTTEEAKTFIIPSLYREMQCEVTTYFVTSK